MHFRDYCDRMIRYEGGSYEWLKIPRHQCDNPRCHKVHRMLPDFLVPYKHYTEDIICGVLDETVRPTDADSEDYPSEQTMLRWHHWLVKNQLNIDGHLKSIAYRELGFSMELLKSGVSLLTTLRSSIPDGWLRSVIRYIYNSGNSLLVYY